MTSYVKNWLYNQNPEVKPPEIPAIETSDAAAQEEDDTETIHGEDDAPPAFPAVDSAQRANANLGMPVKKVSRILNDSRLMPPPPSPSLAARRPGVSGTSPFANLLAAPSSSSPSLLPPPTTTKPPPKQAKRAKIALAPGHGPLDWANLKKSGQDLRGTDTLLRVTPSLLKEHRTREDAWSAFSGKVYNITHYLPYHPGGEKELMRVAGRDGSKLFASTHAWVNLEYMLDECLVGFMVPE